jgi:ABC-type glutathione transport system ATPase component
VGKSTLASILLGEEIPQNWKSTDGLIIFFGRNGIHLKDKTMVPLRKGNTT